MHKLQKLRSRLTMPHNDATYLILRHRPVQHQTEGHQDPWQIWRRKHQQPQEGKPRFRVPSAPYVHQRRTQRRAEEGDGEQWREAEEGSGGVDKEPGKVGGRSATALFQEARVALEEEDVEEKVEG